MTTINDDAVKKWKEHVAQMQNAFTGCGLLSEDIAAVLVGGGEETLVLRPDWPGDVDGLQKR